MTSPDPPAHLTPATRASLQRHFDLAHLHQTSLSAWSPVHRATTTSGRPVVVKPTPGGHARAVVRELARRWWTTSLPALRGADLPLAAATGDVKAANFRFTDHGPVMVDPDNAAVQPRILDLALTVALFHDECPTAPGGLFDPGQWTAFATAYLEQVDLTQVERRLWPAALDHILWEEGTWALEDNDQDAWDHPRQGTFLRELALATPEHYPLPAR